MARHSYWVGLIGILAAVACQKNSDDSGDDASGRGGTSTPNPYAATGGSSAATNTGNVPPPAALGGRTSTVTATNTGGVTSTATTPTVGGTPPVDGGPNPNRTLTPAEADEITASACNGWAIEPEASAGSKLELVIDVSSSMNSQARGTNRSKWEVTRDALIEAVPGLASGGGLPANTSVGLMFYPNMINDTVSRTPTEPSVCINTGGEVPMFPLGGNTAEAHRTLLRQRLTEAVLGRGTPTHDAYDYVLYNTVLSDAQKAIEGDPYILLITDGMPTLYKNCYNPGGQLSNLEGDPIVQAIDVAYGLGVKTFVVGSPGSEDGRAWLSMAAFLGGTAAGGCNPGAANGPYCHMDMTTAPDFSAALKSGLAQVMSTITSCKFEIPATSADGAEVVDLDKIAPIISFSNGQILLIGKSSSTASTCRDGYRIVSNKQLELCTNTCEQLNSDPLARVQFVFGCSPTEITETPTTI